MLSFAVLVGVVELRSHAWVQHCAEVSVEEKEFVPAISENGKKSRRTDRKNLSTYFNRGIVRPIRGLSRRSIFQRVSSFLVLVRVVLLGVVVFLLYANPGEKLGSGTFYSLPKARRRSTPSI